MRIIPKIDIKNSYVVKSINLEGVRRVGDPNELAKKYYRDGADEIIFMDVVASLYGMNNIFDLIKKFSKDIFIPITVGGGIRNEKDIENALKCGADKVAINSAGIKNPIFLKNAVKIFGASSIVASIEAKKIDADWNCFYEFGRENSGKKIIKWISEINDIGCAEILITSIDKDGVKKGYDIDLIKLIDSKNFNLPLIYSGGYGKKSDIDNIKGYLQDGDALSVSSVLHYKIDSIINIKRNL